MTINQSEKDLNYNNFNFNFGFTLAEVLITLGIIGIVASMTIPTIISNINDAQYKSAWKKAYSLASQAYTMAVNENGKGFGDYGDTTNYNGDTKFSALQSQLKVTKFCNGDTFGNCWAENGVTPTTSGGTPFNSGQNSRTGFVTNNGMFWLLYSQVYALIAVDINGNKGPNQWGKDVLKFIINDTTISPAKADDPTGNSVNFLIN